MTSLWRVRLCVGVTVWCVASPGRFLAAETPRLPEVSQAMRAFVDDGTVAGVVTLVARGEQILHLEALGLRDREAQDPLRTDDLFWIASMTKPMTATALMILQDEGRLSVDDPVSKYLPEYAEVRLENGERPSQPVLIRHLLTHTAGLTALERRPPPDTRSLEEQSRLMAARPLKWEPGTRWEYGWGLQVVGRIIEVVSGQPYDVFMQQRIFDPLKMTRTTFHLTPELRMRLAQVYKLNESRTGLVPAEHRYVAADPEARQTPMPSGGLFSCAADVHRFYATILRGGEWNGTRIVSREAVQQMTTPQVGDLTTGFTPGCTWGLGWCLVRQPQGVTATLSPGSFGHGGAYGTQVWVDPVRGLVTVLMIQRSDLGNSDGSAIRQALHEAVARAVAP